jgi:hypothetical protein
MKTLKVEREIETTGTPWRPISARIDRFLISFLLTAIVFIAACGSATIKNPFDGSQGGGGESSHADAAHDDTSIGTVCSPGASRCSGASGVQTCAGDGSWGTVVPCGNATCIQSVGGQAACQGGCGPGETQCSANALETCTAAGTWGAAVPCTNQTCVGSAGTASCAGVCVLGDKQCLDNTPQTCNDSGGWVSSTACPYDCTSGVCTGTCTSGTSQSQACGNCGTQSRICANGAWGTYGACSGQGACAPNATSTQACGNCGTQTRTCSASCAWGAFGSCGGQGICSATATENCGSTAQGCHQGVSTCSSNCTWGACVNASCSEFAVTTTNSDVSCGPACFNGTTCNAVIGATCPVGTQKTRCDPPDNYGGHGTCVSNGWAYASAQDASESITIQVSGCDGTACSVANCYCEGTP